MPRPSNSGFHGVRYEAFRKKFKVSVWNPVTNRLIHGGYYDTAEVAARRYDEMALEIRGAGGLLNFPREAREKEKSAKAVREVKAEPADAARSGS